FLCHSDDPIDKRVKRFVDRGTNLRYYAHDLAGNLTESGESSEEVNGQRQQAGQYALDFASGGADVALRNRDDRVDEGGDDLNDLRDLINEDHDRVVDRDDGRDKAGARNEHRDQLRYRLLHYCVDNKRLDTRDDLILESGEFVFNDFPGRLRTTCRQRDDDVEGRFEALHDQLAVWSERLHDLSANLRPRNAEHAQRELAKLRQRQSFRNVNALQRAGQPVDQSPLQMVDEVAAEVHEAKLGRLHEISDERQRVLEDALHCRGGLLHVTKRAGAYDVEHDLEQFEHRVDAPAHKLAHEAAEHGREFCECFRNEDDVFERERLERRQEQRRDLADETDELRERGLEPSPGSWNRLRILHLLPNITETDHLE